MPIPRMSRDAARVKALEVLSAMTEEEDSAITQAALADPDARPLVSAGRADKSLR